VNTNSAAEFGNKVIIVKSAWSNNGRTLAVMSLCIWQTCSMVAVVRPPSTLARRKFTASKQPPWLYTSHTQTLPRRHRTSSTSSSSICTLSNHHLLPIRKRSTLTAVGRSQLLARWPGTLFRILPRHPTSSTDCFRRLLKTYLFVQYQCLQHIRGSQRSRTIQIDSLTHLTVVPARDWTTAATQQ